MIHFLTGENSFERERFLKHATTSFSGTVEKLAGGEVDALRLGESLQAQSLFGDKRLVIVDELSSNKAVWEQLPDLLEQVSEDVTLILIEPKPDKRTRTYKDLLKRATVHDFAVWTAKNQRDAEQWLGKEAKEFGAKLTQVHIRHLIRRVGLDQWRLHYAVRKLALVDEVTEAIMTTSSKHIQMRIFSSSLRRPCMEMVMR